MPRSASALPVAALHGDADAAVTALTIAHIDPTSPCTLGSHRHKSAWSEERPAAQASHTPAVMRAQIEVSAEAGLGNREPLRWRAG